MDQGVLPLQDLRGPYAGEAVQIILKGLSLTFDQAQHISNLYDIEDVEYGLHCTLTWDALEVSGRMLPLGWFEAIFCDSLWAQQTKALHAIADAVMACLVRDMISLSAFHGMSKPWLNGEPEDSVVVNEMISYA